MAKTTKQPSRDVVLTPRWQLLFVVVILGAFIAEIAQLLSLYLGHGQYIGAGTWAYTISGWVFPALLAALSFIYAIRRYQTRLQQLFIALFMTVIVMSVYSACSLLENRIRLSGHWFYTGTSDNLWLAFGWEWATMLVFLVAHGFFLAWLYRRSKR